MPLLTKFDDFKLGDTVRVINPGETIRTDGVERYLPEITAIVASKDSSDKSVRFFSQDTGRESTFLVEAIVSPPRTFELLAKAGEKKSKWLTYVAILGGLGLMGWLFLKKKK